MTTSHSTTTHEDFIGATDAFYRNPDDSQAAYQAESAFWNFIIEEIAQRVRDKEPVDAFLSDHKNLINWGISSGMGEAEEQFRKKIEEAFAGTIPLQVHSLSDYIEQILKNIAEGNKKQVIESDLKTNHLHLKRMESEGESLVEARGERLREACSAGQKTSPMIEKYHNLMIELDQMEMDSDRTKKTIASGTFVTVQDKREHARREKQIETDQHQVDTFLNSLENREEAARIKQISRQIGELNRKIISMRFAIEGLEKELAELTQEQNNISPLEIENHLRRELEYTRDLVKLAAKRLHMTGKSVPSPGDLLFSPKDLKECLDTILDFDPELFNNDRMRLFGLPAILMVPGTGHAVFDWKHNQIVVPTIPFQKQCMTSLAVGMIEYRLDVDEDKKLIHSYSQLPENKKIRSILKLKAKLVKEYIVWMTSEFKGYRVLGSASRKWFDREIAPGKNDLYTPLEFRPFMMTSSDLKQELETVEGRCAGTAEPSADDLWRAGILNYHIGNFERAVAHFALFTRKPGSSALGFYNLGIACMKNMRKSEAITAFKSFCEQRRQSWWSTVAHDHIRQLQAH